MKRALAVCALGLAAASPAAAQRRWGIEIGHSYSSARALHQPATLAVHVADRVTTELDAGVLVGGPLGRLAGLELGARASAGSARTRAERSYGALARGYVALDRWVMASSGEYEADGGFDVQKGVAAIEATPLGARGLCLGVRCAASRLRWRPWIGAAVGNTFRGASGLLQPEGSAFVRAYLRTEVSWEPRPGVELDAEATGWYLARGSNGRTNTTASLAVALGRGFSIAAKGQLGAPPPRFLYSRSVSVGLGFVLRRED